MTQQELNELRTWLQIQRLIRCLGPLGPRSNVSRIMAETPSTHAASEREEFIETTEALFESLATHSTPSSGYPSRCLSCLTISLVHKTRSCCVPQRFSRSSTELCHFCANLLCEYCGRHFHLIPIHLTCKISSQLDFLQELRIFVYLLTTENLTGSQSWEKRARGKIRSTLLRYFIMACLI